MNRPHYHDLEIEDLAGEDLDLFTVEPKYDGIYVTAHLTGAGLRLVSRTGRDRGFIPFESDKTGVFVGEYITGSSWGHSQGLDGVLFLFDVVKFDGVDVSSWATDWRRWVLERCHKVIRCSVPSVRLAASYEATEAARLWRDLEDFEGLVIKPKAAEFGQGWARIKRRTSEDYVVIGMNEGGGRWAGCGVASIRGALFDEAGDLIHVVNVGGLTDAQRLILFHQADDYVGRVFEAEGLHRYDSGALRNPAFSRWRDDKAPAECLLRRSP